MADLDGAESGASVPIRGNRGLFNRQKLTVSSESENEEVDKVGKTEKNIIQAFFKSLKILNLDEHFSGFDT
jgi:hypothetical protein